MLKDLEQSLREIVEEPFENRSKDNHKKILSVIMEALPETTQ